LGINGFAKNGFDLKRLNKNRFPKKKFVKNDLSGLYQYVEIYFLHAIYAVTLES